jgi:hypothetical protein
MLVLNTIYFFLFVKLSTMQTSLSLLGIKEPLLINILFLVSILVAFMWSRLVCVSTACLSTSLIFTQHRKTPLKSDFVSYPLKVFLTLLPIPFCTSTRLF